MQHMANSKINMENSFLDPSLIEPRKNRFLAFSLNFKKHKNIGTNDNFKTFKNNCNFDILS